MKKLTYYISLPFLYLLSILPFPILYLKSKALYFLIYYVFGYRKKVVYDNLSNAFPDKRSEEIKILAKNYYKHLSDIFVETIKSLTLSASAVRKHIKFKDPDFFQKYIEKKQPVIVLMGHSGNWEWASFCMSLNFSMKLLAIYQPLSNKNFDKLFYNMRKRFSAVPVKMADTYKTMLKYKNETFATTFIADQTPSPQNAYWFRFLNQETPFFKGGGILSVKTNYPVVYVNVEKIKRGKYQIHTEELFGAPAKEEPENIIRKFAEQLEAAIEKQPETWLWSHKRWKHKKPL